jgi:hypothetical protein
LRLREPFLFRSFPPNALDDWHAVGVPTAQLLLQADLFQTGSISVPGQIAMLTLTLKNIPPHLHARLKESAEKNRRSLNSEILTRLERDVVAPKVDRAKLASDLKAFTERLPYVDHRIGDRYKRKGLK